MKLKFKKLLAIVLCMTMVFTSTLPHFANADEKKGSEIETTESIEASEESLPELEETTETAVEEDKNLDESKAETDDTELGEEESESDKETEAESDETEKEETEASEENESESTELETTESETAESETTESETAEGETAESETSESAFDEEKVASKSEIGLEETQEKEVIEDVNVATPSLAEEISEIKVATASYLEVNDKEYLLGYIPLKEVFAPIDRESNSKLFRSNPLPSKYDSREHTNPDTGLSYIPPIREQEFGDCWTFANIAMYEADLRKKGLLKNEDDNLSEACVSYFTHHRMKDATGSSEYIDNPGLEGEDYVDVTEAVQNIKKQSGTEKIYADLGGNLVMATNTASAYVGVVLEDEESNYAKLAAFKNKKEQIDQYSINPDYAFNMDSFVLGNAYYFNKTDRDVVKQAIVDHGAVGISYYGEVKTPSWYSHKDGDEWYYYTNEDEDNANHAISIIGWDDTKSASLFYATNGSGNKVGEADEDGAWLCRNSWGDYSRSNGGYFWMSYKEPSLSTNMYAIDAIPRDTYTYNYHYDTSCYPAWDGGNTTNKPRFANVFKVSDENQKLEAVNVGLGCANTKFDIYIYTKDTEMSHSQDGTLVYSKEYTKETAGIYTIPLDTPVFLKKNTYFSIVVLGKQGKYVFNGESRDNLFYVSYDVYDVNGSIKYYNEAAYGQSYVSRLSQTPQDLNKPVGNSELDWRKFSLVTVGDKTYGKNWRIKGLTNPTPTHILNKNWFNASSAGIQKADVTKVTIMEGGNVTSHNATWDIDGEGLKGYIVNSTEAIIYMPEGDKLITNEDASEIFANFTNAAALVGLPILDTSRATNMDRMFYMFGENNRNIVVQIDGLEDLDVSNVTSMHRMLAYANTIQGENLDLSKWNTSKLENMEEMFRFHNGCIRNINLNGWDTSSLTNMAKAFEDCYKVETIDLRSFDTSKVTTFISCFAADGKLTTIRVSDTFVTTGATNSGTGLMFSNCTSLVGGNGTSYADKITTDESNARGGKYAKIDAPGQEGYFTGIVTKYNVTFNMNGHGTQIAPKEIAAGGLITKPDDPSEVGYNFLGWFKDSGLQTEWNFATDKVKGDVTLYAKWTLITYTITYDLKGVSATKPADVIKTYTQNVTLASPTGLPSGYTFVAWYEDSNLTTQYTGNKDLSTTQGATVTIYAKWKQQVIFDANGHGTAPASKEVEVGSITLPSITATGYTFGGWYLEAACTNKAGDAGQSYNVTGAITFYAKWTAKEYTITYNVNGGNAVSPTSFNKTYGTAYSGNLATPTRTGYTFAGWFTTSALTTAYDKAKDDIYKEGTTSYTIYAKWTAKSYTITYNVNGGNAVTPTSFNKTYGIAYSGNLATPTRTGYTFAGWYTTSALTTAYDKSNDAIYVEGTTNYTIYAKWTAKNYTITYNANGGSVSPSSFGKTYATAYASDLATPTRAGYTFGGWYVDNNTFNTAYNKSNDAIYKEGTTSYTIYAKWTENDYTITLNENGGSYTNGYTEPTSRKYTQAVTLPTSANIQKTGHTFEGWYENASFTGSKVTGIAAKTASNKEYWAKWKANEYTITYNLNRGSWTTGYSAPTKWEYSTSVSTSLPVSANVIRNHYTFGGWFKNKDLSGTAVPTLNSVTENLTLYAKWTTSEPYKTITFNPGGGSGSMEEQFAFSGEDTILYANEFKRSGYSFSRWKADNGSYYNNGANIGEVTADLVLEAEWKTNSAPVVPPSGGGGNSGGGGSGGGGGGGGGGGRLAADAIPTTLPNGQQLTQAASSEPVVTVSAAGVAETVSTDATTGITSTTVSLSFNTNSVVHDTANSTWEVDAGGKWHLKVTSIFGHAIEPIDSWACVNTNAVNEAGQAIVVSNFYFFNSRGEMVTGWLSDATGKTYFLETENNSEIGKMTRGWKSIAGKYFYFNVDGVLQKGGVTPDGFTLDATGAWVS